MNKSERNTGRKLVVVIESADKRDLSGLQAMLALTRTPCVRRGLDISQWPESVSEVMNDEPPPGTRVIQRTDDYSETHRFLLLPYPDHDLLLGVSSRHSENMPGQATGNLASNLIVELLRPPHGAHHKKRVAPYGTVIAAASNRLWRTETGGSHVQSVCREWHIWIHTDVWSFDPLDPNSGITGQIQSSLDTAQVSAFVKNSVRHRTEAHEGGIVKFARSKTHPAISIDRQSGRMSYDLHVVRVIRDMADRLIDGWTFDQLATEFAEQLPSYTLREEEDLPGPDKHTGRTRSERNEARKKAGRPIVPLRYLDDDITPNPAYRPETVADMADPASAIRKMFSGPSLPWQLRGADLDAIIRDDLDGIHPRRAYPDFFATGIFRRLHRDQERSNKTYSRFCWINHELGKVDDVGFILTPTQATELKDRLELPPVNPQQTTLPLAGVFTVEGLDEPLHTSRGTLTADSGRLVFRTGHNTQAEPGYRIYLEPPGTTPHGSGLAVVAWMLADEVHASVVEGIVTALDGKGEPAELTLPLQETDKQRERRRLERERQDAEKEFKAATRALKKPDLSERQEEILQDDADEAEKTLEGIEAHLHSLVDEDDGPSTADADAPLKDLADMLGAILSAPMLPVAVARSCRQILRVVFRDPVLQLDPTTAEIVWRARLELETTDGGTLNLPVTGRVRNRSADTWLGGVGGQFWAGTTFTAAWDRLDLKTPAALATHWRKPLIERLMTDDQIVTPLRDRAAASLLVRCPDATLLNITLALLRGDVPDADPEQIRCARELFFDPDRTTPTTWATRVCKDALQQVQRTAAGEQALPQ